MKFLPLIAFLLGGCGVIPWLGAHQTEVIIVGTTAGATASVLSAANNAIDLKQNIEEEAK